MNGRCAIVVPDNVLFEGGAGETVRRNLLKQCDVHTLLRLPTGIFYAQGVKANVPFLDAKPAQEKPWTKALWVYDLRTNMHFTQKTNPRGWADLDEFVECDRLAKRHLRKPTWSDADPEGRRRSFDYEDLMKRDKVNLDIFWLRDKSLEDYCGLHPIRAVSFPMKLGILTDIHEHVNHLRTALARFRRERVDQIVVIGDVFETGERIDETCRLLAEAKVVGVWGNHDFGLCVEPHESTRAKYPPSVMDFMGTLRPRLELGGCHFMHVEPWLNPEDVADLWYFEGPPDCSEKLDRIFSSVSHRIMFAGHYHKWLLARPDGIMEWAGEGPILLDNGRCFMSVGAVCEGQFAIFDTDTSRLIPFNEV